MGLTTQQAVAVQSRGCACSSGSWSQGGPPPPCGARPQWLHRVQRLMPTACSRLQRLTSLDAASMKQSSHGWVRQPKRLLLSRAGCLPLLIWQLLTGGPPPPCGARPQRRPASTCTPRWRTPPPPPCAWSARGRRARSRRWRPCRCLFWLGTRTPPTPAARPPPPSPLPSGWPCSGRVTAAKVTNALLHGCPAQAASQLCSSWVLAFKVVLLRQHHDSMLRKRMQGEVLLCRPACSLQQLWDRTV